MSVSYIIASHPCSYCATSVTLGLRDVLNTLSPVIETMLRNNRVVADQDRRYFVFFVSLHSLCCCNILIQSLRFAVTSVSICFGAVVVVLYCAACCCFCFGSLKIELEI